MRTKILASILSLAAVVAVAAPGSAHGQDNAGLMMPARVLHQIALDFDAGRNPFYCYFGTRDASTPDRVNVDSVTMVAGPTDCTGSGLGFVSRIDDRFFLVNVLKGLIDAMPQFLVVSAFYRTEDLDRDGGKFHTAHALSIIRSVGATSVANGSS